jgi:hypothetical protein
MYERVHLGLAADALNTRLKATQELVAESGSTALVPGKSFRNVTFGFWGEDQLSGHARRGLGVSLLPTPAQKPGSS